MIELFFSNYMRTKGQDIFSSRILFHLTYSYLSILYNLLLSIGIVSLILPILSTVTYDFENQSHWPSNWSHLPRTNVGNWRWSWPYLSSWTYYAQVIWFNFFFFLIVYVFSLSKHTSLNFLPWHSWHTYIFLVTHMHFRSLPSISHSHESKIQPNEYRP